MKSLTNKLVMSVLALVLTGVALSVGVLAWFTINNRANVEQFSGTVQTGQGFYISADGAAWKNTLESSDLVLTASPVVFRAVTANATGKTLTALDGGTPQAADFIEFKLYFVGNSALLNVAVTGITISSPSTTSWIPGQTVALTDSATNGNTPVVRSASDAARVAFIDLVSTTSNAVVFENGLLGTNTKGKGSFNEAAPVLGNNQAVLYYNHFATTANPALTQAQFDAAHPYTTTETGSNLNVNVASFDTIANTTSIQPAGWNVPTQVTGVIGTDYKVAAVTVRVWIEGWDQEALNAILSGTVNVTLNLEGKSA